MSQPPLIVVSGLPASGKSALARDLARLLSLPLVSKDDYKETVADALPELENAVLGPLSFRLMYRVAGVVLAAGTGVLLETHFHLGVSEPHILGLAQRHGARLVQVYCHAPIEVLEARDRERVHSGQRHPTHSGLNWSGLPPTAGREPLRLDAPLLAVDTSDFGRVDLPAIADWLRRAIA